MDPYNPIIAARARAMARGTPRWAARVDALRPAFWLAAHALALWPAFAWVARRVADGSDDPLGLVALALLALAALGGRLSCRREPRWRWLGAALAVTLVATALIGTLPPLAYALLAALALGSAWAAFRAPRSPVLPVLGLLWLALPLVASLQFYVGYPLRVATAWASAGLLRLAGFAAEPSGASMLLDGTLVLVDAPCSGVQLAWFAYASACGAALWAGVRDRRFVARLPWVGLVALAGNVVRNAVLVVLEGGAIAAPGWLHDAVGLAVLGAVVAAVVALTARPEPCDAA